MWPIIPVVVVTNTVTLARLGMVQTLTDVVASVVSATVGLSMIIVILCAIYSVWERRTLGRGSREE
jgi:F0F1-type ATP synthase membrane subunit a